MTPIAALGSDSSLLRQILRAPLTTGAIAPSSQRLARAMAKAVGETQHIIELGAGTGAVTQELLAHYPGGSLVAVELQPCLADGLRDRYPGLDIRQAPADQVLREFAAQGPVAIVSSLPFRSLPEPIRSRTIRAIEWFLLEQPGSTFVQYTYQPRAPFKAAPGFFWEKLGTVWRNVPPAGVWALKHL